MRFDRSILIINSLLTDEYKYLNQVDGCISCCKITAFFGILFYVNVDVASFQWASSSSSKSPISNLSQSITRVQLLRALSLWPSRSGSWQDSPSLKIRERMIAFPDKTIMTSIIKVKIVGEKNHCQELCLLICQVQREGKFKNRSRNRNRNRNTEYNKDSFFDRIRLISD